MSVDLTALSVMIAIEITFVIIVRATLSLFCFVADVLLRTVFLGVSAEYIRESIYYCLRTRER